MADLLESVQVLALADHADEAQVRPPELRRLPHAAGLYLMAVSAGKWLASGWYRRTRGVWRSAGR